MLWRDAYVDWVGFFWCPRQQSFTEFLIGVLNCKNLKVGEWNCQKEKRICQNYKNTKDRDFFFVIYPEKNWGEIIIGSANKMLFLFKQHFEFKLL